jgi:hypothetical protein
VPAVAASGGGYYPDGQTVYTADTGDDSAADTGTQLADTDTDAETDDTQSQDINNSPAAQLAAEGVTDPPQDAKLLPLGVYTLAPKGQDESTASVRLAVSKDGVVRGVYYDSLGHQGHPVRGAVDKKTQRVAWTVGDNKNAVFETSLASLTHDKGNVSVQLANGQKRPFTIARYEKDESDKDETPEAKPSQSNS